MARRGHFSKGVVFGLLMCCPTTVYNVLTIPTSIEVLGVIISLQTIKKFFL